jgi:hypothetical protein
VRKSLFLSEAGNAVSAFLGTTYLTAERMEYSSSTQGKTQANGVRTGFPIVSAYFFTLASKARYIRRLQARFMIDHIRQAPGKLSFTSSEAMDGIQHYSSKAAIIAEYNVFIFNAMR